MIIKREQFNENPRKIAKKTFYDNLHYPLVDHLKLREFYEFILVDTN